MARVRELELEVCRGFYSDDGRDLLAAVRSLFVYGPGEDRATGYLYVEGEQDWPAGFCGPVLLDDLEQFLGIRFPIAAFQAYRNGSGCDWHADSPFDVQAILSLGITRTFGIRPAGEDTPQWIQDRKSVV